MTPEQVCLIIKACGESAVTELKFGDLYVRLGPSAPAPRPVAPATALAESVDSNPTLPAAEIADIQRRESEAALEKETLETRMDQLAQAFIENPVLAEQLLAQGELTEHEERDDEET